MDILTDNYKSKAYDDLLKVIKQTAKQLRELEKSTNRDNPVDVDILKTIKAMNYELVYEIVKKSERSNNAK